MFTCVALVWVVTLALYVCLYVAKYVGCRIFLSGQRDEGSFLTSIDKHLGKQCIPNIHSSGGCPTLAKQNA